MFNRAGKAVEVTAASVRAAAANWWSSDMDWTRGGGFALMITDEPSAEAWPIAAATFIVMPALVKDVDAAREALKFFAWTYVHGDKAAGELGYVPMPFSVKLLAMNIWTDIKGPGGESVFTAK